MIEKHQNITFLELRKHLESLGICESDDILVHGSSLTEEAYESVCEKIFDTGISKNTKQVAPFMSILATASLLSDKFDKPSQIIDYNFGNTTFVIRIPREYDGLYLGKIDQKYARRTSGLQDESVSFLDLLDLESIPREFIVCAIRESKKEHQKYDLLINPKYFELDKSLDFKKRIEFLVENSDTNVISKAVVKDYLGLEKLDSHVYKHYLDFLTIGYRDSWFVKTLINSNNKR